MPLEVRQMIVKELLESSLPVPTDGEPGFQVFQQDLRRAQLTRRSFTLAVVLPMLTQLISALCDLYKFTSKTWAQVLREIFEE